ncbi:MAG: hypothetical protein KIT84_37635 [Labilithrix sp.]|nr:hypothetical protein [Labilithrix sp.]MCW5816780.1 hypothetical protein [Labilithrix sp.]
MIERRREITAGERAEKRVDARFDVSLRRCFVPRLCHPRMVRRSARVGFNIEPNLMPNVTWRAFASSHRDVERVDAGVAAARLVREEMRDEDRAEGRQ